MDITFSCTKCGQRIVIDEVGAGLSVQCPSCNADLIVPDVTNISEYRPHPSANSATSTGELVEYEIRDEGTAGKWLKIETLNFHGQCASSPNGRYWLAWHDAWQAGEKGNGAFLLLEDHRILCRGKLQRPNEGEVANNGHFVLNDEMLGEGLKGTFYAFASNGEVIVRKRFQANLYTNGISEDGCFAACQTCTPDGFLYLFDLIQKRLLKKLNPVDGAAGDTARFRFDTKNQVLHLCYPLYLYTVELQYRFDGSFVAVTAFESSEMGAKSEGNEHYEALTRKRLGQIYLECGERAKALAHLEAALQLDPEIGGSRLVNQLKQTLSAQT